MMVATLDLVIRGGTVVDGTGTPGLRADVGIRDGRIVEIGVIDKEAEETIDAEGLIVAPGFVDIHTHYDAQVFWDRTVSPSSRHGVTTIIGGNCGFSIAPLNGNQDDADYLIRMLARVEGMPLESLRAGAPWDWRSFGDFLGQLDGTLAINAGFMVGHSALRRFVMGARAVGHKATVAEVTQMQELLRKSLREGGMGFSSTISPGHHDGEGNPVPSRHADDAELFALASVVREFPGTTLEFLPDVTRPFDEEQMGRMTKMSLAAKRPLNWNVLLPNIDQPETQASHLAASDYAAERGAKVMALIFAQAPEMRINLATGYLVDSLVGWNYLFKLPLPDRILKLSDPAVRQELVEGLLGPQSWLEKQGLSVPDWTVGEVYSSANKPLIGKTVGAIAEEWGKSIIDTLLDISLADGLKTSFVLSPLGGDSQEAWDIRTALWHDDRTIIGASDAGAHLDMIDTFAFSSQLLGGCCRERKLIALEEAVHQLTDRPARFYGLRERGRLEPGYWADIVVFDSDKIGSGPTHMRHDLPADGMRLYADALGIYHVLVNGVEIVRNQEFLNKFPGKIFHSGKDTETVPIGTAEA